MVSGIPAWIACLERDESLHAAERFCERADVLDRIDTVFPAALEPAEVDAELYRRAMTLRARFEAIDGELFAGLRAELRSGSGRERLLRLAAAGGRAAGDEYGPLDDLVAGLLQLDAPEEVRDTGPDMVFYQPTPARHVFDLIERAAPGADDVLVDLGSGLGHVPLLVGLCTDARAIGVELQPAYVARARACAQAMNLRRVEFIAQDARDADFSRGTLFYLYTPFGGAILRTVLDALRKEAGRRAFRVCSYGPCTPVIAQESWLGVEGAVLEDRVVVFRTLHDQGWSPT